jgi:hypothetical protein
MKEIKFTILWFPFNFLKNNEHLLPQIFKEHTE